MQFLIAKGANIDTANPKGLSPFAKHIEQWREDSMPRVLELLIVNHAKVAKKDFRFRMWDPSSQFTAACKEECFNYATAILENTLKSKSYAPNSWKGKEPFIIAYAEGQQKLAQFIITNAANKHIADGANRSALFTACDADNLPLAEFLIKNGADINVIDKDGQSPLSKICAKGKVKAAEFLITKGAEINTVDYKGRSLLANACAAGKLKLVELLIKNASDINITDTAGNTPLLLAIARDSRPIVELLIKNAADINIADKEGNTPLLLASARDYSPIVELLIKNAADINITDNAGNTPLLLAIARDYSPIVRVLVIKHLEQYIAACKTFAGDKSDAIYDSTISRLIGKASFGLFKSVLSAKLRELV